jgi:hypothetical protein
MFENFFLSLPLSINHTAPSYLKNITFAALSIPGISYVWWLTMAVGIQSPCALTQITAEKSSRSRHCRVPGGR